MTTVIRDSLERVEQTFDFDIRGGVLADQLNGRATVVASERGRLIGNVLSRDRRCPAVMPSQPEYRSKSADISTARNSARHHSETRHPGCRMKYDSEANSRSSVTAESTGDQSPNDLTRSRVSVMDYYPGCRVKSVRDYHPRCRMKSVTDCHPMCRVKPVVDYDPICRVKSVRYHHPRCRVKRGRFRSGTDFYHTLRNLTPRVSSEIDFEILGIASPSDSGLESRVCVKPTTPGVE